MFTQCLAQDAQKVVAEIIMMMVIIVFIRVIINIIIQLETKHLLLKKEVQIECYPTHRQKCHLNKSKRPLKSYCKQRILLNIQINNGNPALKQNSMGGGQGERCALRGGKTPGNFT